MTLVRILPKNRRARFVVLALLVAMHIAFIPLSCMVIHELGGAYDHEPGEMAEGLSSEAHALVEASYADIGTSRLVDYHVHVLGLGKGGTGCFVHPAMKDWSHPIRRVRYMIFAGAAGVDDKADADRLYMERVRAQILAIGRPGVYHLLAFDKCHDRDGRENLEHTDLYIPNDYVLRLVKEHPDIYRATVSIHPYRKDAIAELERCHAAGARYVKWIPNAMRMDPSDAQCEPFYEKMRELGMALLTHTGEEQAVQAADAQMLGNPLLLRKPLDMGVKVIAAHCATLGEHVDLDDPDKRTVPSFDLFLRLLEDPRYRGLLFGDISAITLTNREPRTLETLLARTDIHDRLINGSDYPVCAVNVAIRLGPMVKRGYISAQERKLIKEIYDYNPLLFDYVLKRALRHPKTGTKFPASVFMAHPDLP
jgi:uncharacterized protein